MIIRESAENVQVSLKADKITVSLRDDQYTVLIISPSVLLRMRNVSEKNVAQKIKTHILCSVFFFFGIHAFYETCGKML